METGFKVQEIKNGNEKKLEEVGGKSNFAKALKDASNVVQLKAVIRDAFKVLGLLDKGE